MSDTDREQLEAELEALRAENAQQAGEIERLTRKITELEQRLNQGSKNSSLPPSSDSPKQQAEATKTRADRRAEAKAKRKGEIERRRGKQPGAPGQNLAMKAVPDEIVTHEPTNCSSCGEDLSEVDEEGIERRQVFDTPDPIIVSTEHRSAKKRCTCGKLNAGAFPREATAPASYGPNVRAVALYLLFGQHLSVERTADAMSTMLGAEVSTGFVASLAKEAAGGLTSFIDVIRRRLTSSFLVHADETSDQVRTDKWWFHVVSNDLYTYLFASPTRAKSAPDEAGVLPEFAGVMVHDRLAMYFKYDKATHAICLAHVLRELEPIGIGWDQGWANDMTALLTEMNNAAHDARSTGATALAPPLLKTYLARYDTIVEQGLLANPAPLHRERDYLERKAYNLVAALKKLKSEATRFATDLRVPMTNNLAERDVRMLKLHSKISSCFQSDDGARNFAAIRSYISTARKHKVNALDALAMLFRGDAWMPPNTA
ncbi:MAG: IS66 family transposase [Acidimicrobiales bacterium]